MEPMSVMPTITMRTKEKMPRLMKFKKYTKAPPKTTTRKMVKKLSRPLEDGWLSKVVGPSSFVLGDGFLFIVQCHHDPRGEKPGRGAAAAGGAARPTSRIAFQAARPLPRPELARLLPTIPGLRGRPGRARPSRRRPCRTAVGEPAGMA